MWQVLTLAESFFESGTREQAMARPFKAQPIDRPVYLEMRLPDGTSVTCAVDLRDLAKLPTMMRKPDR